MKLAIAFLLGAAVGAVATALGRGPQDVVDEAAEDQPEMLKADAEDVPATDACVEEDEAGEEPQEESRVCRAEILEACRDLDPVTLQGWSRVSFLCEDGVTRKFIFAGVNGLYLASGETGLLEYRGKAFVGFEKDSGEYITPLFHVLPEAEE